jgi:hypothetical protein
MRRRAAPPPSCRNRNRERELSWTDSFVQTLVVERLFGSRVDCCVEQLQSVCSQPWPAAQELLQ